MMMIMIMIMMMMMMMMIIMMMMMLDPPYTMVEHAVLQASLTATGRTQAPKRCTRWIRALLPMGQSKYCIATVQLAMQVNYALKSYLHRTSHVQKSAKVQQILERVQACRGSVHDPRSTVSFKDASRV